MSEVISTCNLSLASLLPPPSFLFARARTLERTHSASPTFLRSASRHTPTPRSHGQITPAASARDDPATQALWCVRSCEYAGLYYRAYSHESVLQLLCEGMPGKGRGRCGGLRIVVGKRDSLVIVVVLFASNPIESARQQSSWVVSYMVMLRCWAKTWVASASHPSLRKERRAMIASYFAHSRRPGSVLTKADDLEEYVAPFK